MDIQNIFDPAKFAAKIRAERGISAPRRQPGSWGRASQSQPPPHSLFNPFSTFTHRAIGQPGAQVHRVSNMWSRMPQMIRPPVTPRKLTKTDVNRGALKFLDPAKRILGFLKLYHPQIYKGMLVQKPELLQAISGAHQMDGLGEFDFSLDDIMTGVTSFAKTALPIYQQQKMFEAQLKQAASGQPPTPAAIPMTPVYPPQVQKQVDSMGGLSMMEWLSIAGVGIAAVSLLIRKRRRS